LVWKHDHSVHNEEKVTIALHPGQRVIVKLGWCRELGLFIENVQPQYGWFYANIEHYMIFPSLKLT
jgi:hypothetical protein